MSKYSQLPRNTIALLTMRAQRKVDVQDYVNWAVGALADGFDSRSLAILASLDYGVVAQTEAPEYFLKTLKELALPIPDCELAIGNWKQTESIYRKLGLSLPDEMTLLGQHLAELAEQIKEGVIDPVVGLDRIYYEIVFVCMYGSQEIDGTGKRGKSDLKGWDRTGIWEWDELRDHVIYNDHAGRYEKTEQDQIKQEIIAFATDWLENPEARFTPKYVIYKPLPEVEKKIPVQVEPIQQMPKQVQESVQMAKMMPAPSQPELVKAEKIPNKPSTVSDVDSFGFGKTLLVLAIRMPIFFTLSALLIFGLLKAENIPFGVGLVLIPLGLLAIVAISNFIEAALGISKKK